LTEEIEADMSVVGNAKLDGLTTDLKFTGNQYLFTLTIYFIGYVRPAIPQYRGSKILIVAGSLRNSLQHYPQANDAEDMASYSHADVGNRGNIAGSLSKLFRVPRCTVLFGRH
jgi:hypothetical protein